ncbi:Nif3-like dinuclear metal center hexameric protein [bacterium endosymbiont of Escarpia laminata]|nr:MAG: Nif3-like dinuclear metal center hexameric protein [bacterium endosymbiont of Escarpia laminata]
MIMININALETYCNDCLNADGFDDYCPNGLQVEAVSEVNRLMVGVTASQALIDAAVDWGADALLVHHGFFWKGEAAVLRGMKGRRISALIKGGVNLLVYHLPLDAHPVWGNNRQLAERLDFPSPRVTEAGNGLLWRCDLEAPLQAVELQRRLQEVLGRAPLHIDSGGGAIQSVGWCTGGAQGFIEAAADLMLDAYISGEISEATVHVARERGIHYFAAGHHATERYGVQALAEHLAARFSLEYRFVDIDNPA